MTRNLALTVAMSLFVFSPADATESAHDYKGYELPAYQIIGGDEEVELRTYAPRLVAEVAVSGDRSEAVNKGFRLLADYIFGENVTASDVPMTSPVTQAEESTQIPMTSPVTQSAATAEGWLVQFGMPRNYTQETLPVPKNPAIKFRQLKAYKAAAYRFSGLWTDKRFNEARARLMAYSAVKGLTLVGTPVFAYYDDPFTAPWNRRNEVIWEIE